MFIYKGTLEKFNKDVYDGKIAEIVKKRCKECHVGVSASLERSFDHSLQQLSFIFNKDSFDQNINCAIEYVIRRPEKPRIDFMLSGNDEKDNSNIVIIEMKQWSYDGVKEIDNSDNLEAMVTMGRWEETNHPSDQALSYARYFEIYYRAFIDNKCRAYPCSYLHNYIEGKPKVITANKYSELLVDSPTYLKHDRSGLEDFVKRYIKKSDNGKIFELLENCEVGISKTAQQNARDLIVNNSHIELIDEQRVVFNAIKAAVKNAIERKSKTTFIINGGAGTGKSVIALKLVGEMLSQGKTSFYLTHNSAPRYAFIDAIKKAEKEINKTNSTTSSFIQYSGQWLKEERKENELDLVVVDEAPRLRKAVQGARAKGLNVIGEVIKSAKVTVFFTDERQFIHKSDIGTIDNIVAEADKYGSVVIQNTNYNLKTQFRCGGSDGYIAFIKNVIYGDELDSPVWLNDFELKFFKDPTEMMDALRILNENGKKSRVVAGYCYNWNHGLDVDIGNFKHPWNFDTKTWGTRSNSFEEIGCAYSCQGLEFDYVGVIIGNDWCMKDGKPSFEPKLHAESDDSSDIYKKRETNPEDAIRLIKNHYYVLLTRGMKGCYIYCQDDKLREYLENKLQEFKEQLMD